jgi:phosphate transport system substrate-binding protein
MRIIAIFYIFYIVLLFVKRLCLTTRTDPDSFKENKQMISKKLLIALLTIAIIGTTSIVLGCTSSTTGPTSTPTAVPTGTSDSLSGTITVAGSSSVGPSIEGYIKPAFEALHKDVKVNVLISDSGTGIKSTQAGTCDIGMSSRALTTADGADLKSTVIAYDGIAVIVNNANGVTNLSKQQIVDIFAGKITNWKDIGGNDAAIDVYQREASSGTRTAFNDLVMKPTNVTDKALQASNTLTVRPHAEAGSRRAGQQDRVARGARVLPGDDLPRSPRGGQRRRGVLPVERHEHVDGGGVRGGGAAARSQPAAGSAAREGGAAAGGELPA